MFAYLAKLLLIDRPIPSPVFAEVLKRSDSRRS